MKVSIITDPAALSRAIKGIASRGAQLDDAIHTAAVSTLYHAEQHGDVTKAAELVLAMPQSSRRKALMLWMAAFAPLRAQYDENNRFAGYKLAKGKKARPFNVEGAEAVPFWDFTRERVPQDFSLERLLSYVQGKLKKAVDSGKLDAQGVADAKAKLASIEV